MRNLMLILFAVLPMSLLAQNNWEVPTEQVQTEKSVESNTKEVKKKKISKNSNPKYLAGAVPVVDGRVQWTLELDVPGKSAEDIYNKMYDFLVAYTKSDNQLEGSQVALVNKAEHSIIASVREWIVFRKSFISLDRAATAYKLFATCKDNHLQLILSRIVFDYTENVPGGNGIYKAEEWITDEEAINKKGTKLYPGSAKFRRGMIDRKDEIFAKVTDLFR